MIDDAGHQRIVEAIDRIDQQSDGEIYCLIAAEASDYREVALAWAALAALLLPVAGVMLGISPDMFLNGGWSVQGSSPDLFHLLSLYALAQAIVFAVVALIASMPKLRLMLTPRFLKRSYVRKAARQHFVSTGIHLKKSQPHVLIFVSLGERQVEIMADDVIHAVTGSSVWEKARDVIIAGMTGADPAELLVRAVEIVGEPLIAHFPATPEHPDINADGVGIIS